MEEIEKKMLSPSAKLCELAEIIETEVEPALSNKKRNSLFLNGYVKDIFIESYKEALELTSAPMKEHLIDLKEWVLASDSFLISEPEMYAIAFSQREYKNISSSELQDLVIDEPQKIKYIIHEIVNGKSLNEEEKNHALSGVLIHVNKKGGFKLIDEAYLIVEKELEKVEDLKLKESLHSTFKDVERVYEEKKTANKKFRP